MIPCVKSFKPSIDGGTPQRCFSLIVSLKKGILDEPHVAIGEHVADLPELTDREAELDAVTFRELEEGLDLRMGDREDVVPADRLRLRVVVGVVDGAGIDRREVETAFGVGGELREMAEARLGRRRRAVGRIEDHVGVFPPDAAEDPAVDLGAGVQEVAGPRVPRMKMQDRRSGGGRSEPVGDDFIDGDGDAGILGLRDLLVERALDDEVFQRLLPLTNEPRPV